MLAVMLNRARLRNLPVKGMSFVPGEQVQEKDCTYHMWRAKMVKVRWAKPPRLNDLTEIHALFASSETGMVDATVEHLRLLPPVARENVILGVVAQLLRENEELRVKLGVPTEG